MSETLLVSITDANKHTVTSVGKPFPNTEMRVLDLLTRDALQPLEKVTVLCVSILFVVESNPRELSGIQLSSRRQGIRIYFPFRIGSCINFSFRFQGELAIRGDFVMKEYDRNPEATAEAFTDDGFLLTGS